MQKTISKSTKARRAASYIPGSNHPKRKVIYDKQHSMQWKEIVEHDEVFSLALNKTITRSRTRHIPA